MVCVSWEEKLFACVRCQPFETCWDGNLSFNFSLHLFQFLAVRFCCPIAFWGSSELVCLSKSRYFFTFCKNKQSLTVCIEMGLSGFPEQQSGGIPEP